MSLNKSKELIETAKFLCRQLRRNQTKAEALLWEQLKGRRLYNYKFYRQYPVFHDFYGYESFFIADFFCYELKLIIELDGELHKYKLRDDEVRTQILNIMGLNVMRFDNDEVEGDISSVLGCIYEFSKSCK